MPKTGRYVITYAHDRPPALGGLPWCLALKDEDGKLRPVAWLRSRDQAERLERMFTEPQIAGDTTHTATPRYEATQPRPAQSPHDTVKRATPLSVLEWIALAGALLVATGVVALIERVIPRPVR